MKIKKLIIHNIASIEDATIDFEKEPLSNTDLFLITGKTGAGKTTILDAICLALYNTAPRVKKNKGEKAKIEKDNIVPSDPRHLMRQNTGEAFVKLFFVGNDNKDYSAEWSVRRGKKANVDSDLNPQVWTIYNADGSVNTSADNSRKHKEVEELVKKIVGLDYDQFCRTTLLAQGEFTEFLKSDEKQKAAILEKISNTGKFRSIGKAIYKRASEAENAFKEEEKNHAQINPLSPEERNAIETEKAEKEASISEREEIAKNTQKKIDWIQNKEIYDKELVGANNELASAKEKVESEDFKNKAKQVREWDATIEVRSNLSNANSQFAIKETATTGIGALEVTFKEAMSGVAFVKNQLAAAETECARLNKEFQAESANISVYENAQTIEAEVKNYVNYTKELSTKTAEKDKLVSTDIPAAEEILNASTFAFEVALAEYEMAEQSLNEANRQLQECNLHAKRAKKEFLKEVKTEKEKLVQKDKEISDTKNAIAENSKLLEDNIKVLECEQKELKRLEEEHVRRVQSIDYFAKKIRASLSEHLGEDNCVCPVCGQKVISLEIEESIEKEHQKAKAEYDAQKAKVENAEKTVNELKSLVEVQTKLQDTKTEERNTISKVLVAWCYDEPDLINVTIDDIDTLIAEVEAVIASGMEIENKREAAQILCNNKLNVKADANTQKQNAANALNNKKSDLERLLSEIAGYEKSVSQVTASINEKLAGSLVWQYNWAVNATEFIEELKNKTKAYNANKDALTKWEDKVGDTNQKLSNIENLRLSILDLKPEWKSIETIEAKEQRNLHNMWVSLNSGLSTQIDRLKNAETEYAHLNTLIEEFLNTNPEYTRESIATLNNITSSAIDRTRTEVNNANNALSTAESKLKDAKEKVTENLSKKPEDLAEGDTEVSLQVLLEANKTETAVLNQRLGEIAKIISDDDEKIKQKGDTKRLEQLRAESEKWKAFNKLYGDAEGNTFSTIAQAFVLESMLEGANKHLENMAPRYKLHVVPGTLILKLEDKFNGYAARSTNTLSGGESFLCSLALALALADFGHHLDVSTLFIDEGFGTLSGEALQNAVNTLKSLHGKNGRQVGIISHREEIREKIPVQITVTADAGSSSSKIEVIEAR